MQRSRFGRTFAWSLSLCAAVAVAPASARAFCGFYVAGSNARLLNRATMVVLMREGTRTVLSMQNTYEGPPEDFALVIPVPIVLSRDNVRTLPRDVFDRVDQGAAPRLVEYWEQNPCPSDNGSLGLGAIGTMGSGARYGSGAGEGLRARSLGVSVEARFEVGEYDVVILSARDSSGLDTWLRQERYRIPEGAEPLLAPYVRAGMKFFVAKVNARRVRFEQGRALLSPLRFHYDSESFSLPVRLGLMNSPGAQDLVVHVLSPSHRFEAANLRNATIPTNLDVDESVKGRFAEFYAALFDRTIAQNPGAVVTEYAWRATACDPCPVPPLTDSDLATLGADVLPSTAPLVGPQSTNLHGSPMVRPLSPQVRGALSPDAIRRVLLRNRAVLTACYQRARVANPSLDGRITINAAIDARGMVVLSSVGAGSPRSATLGPCMAEAVRRMQFPSPADGATARAEIPLSLTVDPDEWWRGYGSRLPGFVLTRLHARYGRELSDDLVFREAPAILGGREMRDASGALEHGAQIVGSENNFQARYAIRHAWTGPVTCANPRRGVWGGPPAGVEGSTQAQAARGLAFAARGAIQLDRVLRAPVDASVAAVTDASLDAASVAVVSRAAQREPSARCSIAQGVASSRATSGLFVLCAAVISASTRRKRKR